jgi:hypothetical protein
VAQDLLQFLLSQVITSQLPLVGAAGSCFLNTVAMNFSLTLAMAIHQFF